jgi:excisionase family DNA binding protein
MDTVRLSDARKVIELRAGHASETVPTQPCWTVPELAAYLQVSRRTITTWIRQGRLRAHRLSTSVTVIEPREVDRFLADHATGGST